MSFKPPVGDATTIKKGIVQLAGDLGGTAASPTVPGLAGKAGTVHTHAISDVTNLQTTLTSKADDSSVVHDTGAETVAGVKTFSSSPIVPTPTTSTQAANKSYVDGVAGSGSAPDATTSSKGIVQLAGDLGGTAASPIVPGLAGKANTSHTHAASDVTSGSFGISFLPAGTTLTVAKAAGVWPARPTSRTDIIVQWKGPDPSPSIVSSGTGGMMDNVDIRMITP